MTTNGEGRPADANGEALPEEPAATPTPEPDALAFLEAERTDLKERLMRALAEMENLRRRSEREAQDARTYAVTGFARDLLTVADNIRRAIETAPKDASGHEEALRPILEGIELTERDLLATLTRHGVKRLEPKGQKFDPNFHQAMFEAPSDDLPSGTVVEVVQSGYSIGERVLRPALVGVSKGRPKPVAPASPDGEPADAPES